MYTIRKTLLAGMGALCVLGVPAYSWAATTEPAGQAQSSQAAQPQRQSTAKTYMYTIQPTDTLWEIAHTDRISISALKKMNKLHSDTIQVGEHLRVPRPVDGNALHKVASAARRRSAQHASGQALKPLFHVPANLSRIYKGAGSRYGIPWTVLAAIHKTETNCAASFHRASSQGAVGPMQFLPSTFAVYAVKPPGQHGRPDIQNVCDAVYTAAHMLQQDGFSRNPAGALYAYNHSRQYVNHILTLAHLPHLHM